MGAEEVEEDDEPFEREDAAAGDKVGGAVYPKCKARGREEAKSQGFGVWLLERSLICNYHRIMGMFLNSSKRGFSRLRFKPP